MTLTETQTGGDTESPTLYLNCTLWHESNCLIGFCFCFVCLSEDRPLRSHKTLPFKNPTAVTSDPPPPRLQSSQPRMGKTKNKTKKHKRAKNTPFFFAHQVWAKSAGSDETANPSATEGEEVRRDITQQHRPRTKRERKSFSPSHFF